MPVKNDMTMSHVHQILVIQMRNLVKPVSGRSKSCNGIMTMS